MARGKFVGKRKADKLNITSLMDALTIILIFLLVNYSEVTEDAELPDFIQLPKVVGKASNSSMGIVIVVGERKIVINKEGENKEIIFSSFEAEKDQILYQIKDELGVIKEQKMKIAEVEGGAKPKLKLSIQASSEIPYSVINSIISTATEHSLNFVDLVALNKEE